MEVKSIFRYKHKKAMSIVQNVKNSFYKMITKNLSPISQKNYIGSVNSISALLKDDLVIDIKTFFELYRIN